jgi:SAM-dependent methyltransferase
VKRIDRYLRRLIPAVPVLSRMPGMGVLDFIDRLTSLPFKEAQGIPPNRYRIRIGVGNRILFNQFGYTYQGVDFWLYVFAQGMANLSSQIVDIGCGCGRYAMPLSRFGFGQQGFAGTYVGIDVDHEMIAWCRDNFPAGTFSFYHADIQNKVYNPAGTLAPQEYSIPVEDASQDFVFSNSLYTHLLEDGLGHYLGQSYRILRPGGWTMGSVFCPERMNGSLGGRWTFSHSLGNAAVETLKYPEAAVGYREAYLRELCYSVGFQQVDIVPGHEQSYLRCRK